jgi:hypothetical protein
MHEKKYDFHPRMPFKTHRNHVLFLKTFDIQGVQKKLNRFEIALNFAKQLLVSSCFFMYIASLGTYNVE